MNTIVAAWGLPKFFFLNPGVVLGEIILAASLIYVAIRNDEGWKFYALFAVAPFLIQGLMLAIIVLSKIYLDKDVSLGLLAAAEVLSVYMIYHSLRRCYRPIAGGVIVLSQVYAMVWGCLISFAYINDDWP